LLPGLGFQLLSFGLGLPGRGQLRREAHFGIGGGVEPSA
jgi:hypothetical protein